MNNKYSDKFNTKFFEWLTNSFKKKFFIQNIRITFVILYIYILIQIKTEKIYKLKFSITTLSSKNSIN